MLDQSMLDFDRQGNMCRLIEFADSISTSRMYIILWYAIIVPVAHFNESAFLVVIRSYIILYYILLIVNGNKNLTIKEGRWPTVAIVVAGGGGRSNVLSQ